MNTTDSVTEKKREIYSHRRIEYIHPPVELLEIHVFFFLSFQLPRLSIMSRQEEGRVKLTADLMRKYVRSSCDFHAYQGDSTELDLRFESSV